ncbi:MAG: hypothetical protein LH618_16835 [Saprospiraceae bacterium]|nr:hypothetical protein [Saprospiraceae bacterium]
MNSTSHKVEQALGAALAMRFQYFFHSLQPFDLFELPFIRLGYFSYGGVFVIGYRLLVLAAKVGVWRQLCEYAEGN